MDILDLEMKKHSFEMDALKEQLRQMEKEQIQQNQKKMLMTDYQEWYKKNNIEIGHAIQDLEEMVMRDLSYNTQVEYYEIPWIQDFRGGAREPNSLKNAIKKTKHTFDIIKEQHINSLLPIKERNSYNICTIDKCSYMNGEPTFSAKSVMNTVPNPSIAETSDKFVALLNIVKNLESRIYDLENK